MSDFLPEAPADVRPTRVWGRDQFGFVVDYGSYADYGPVVDVVVTPRWNEAQGKFVNVIQRWVVSSVWFDGKRCHFTGVRLTKKNEPDRRQISSYGGMCTSFIPISKYGPATTVGFYTGTWGTVA